MRKSRSPGWSYIKQHVLCELIHSYILTTLITEAGGNKDRLGKMNKRPIGMKVLY